MADVSRAPSESLVIKSPRILASIAVMFLVTACTGSGLPPLKGIDRPVDLARFMGDWYVIAFIPIDLPVIGEAGAHNGIESYRLEPDGTIATTYTFREGGFDGPEKVMQPRARVANSPVNSEWKMKFAWFLPAGDFLILAVDDDYQRTIIGVPDRRWVWLMARTPTLPQADYDALVAEIGAMGHDLSKLRKVPQQWPAPAAQVPGSPSR
jgi:apolipoprotein D and lipocalin family protein